jgi:hypothetical protein
VTGEQLEELVLALLARRAPGATICPSEAARAAADDWRALMPAVRDRAADMADRGVLEVTQRGVVVDPRAARGPVRLRLPPT